MKRFGFFCQSFLLAATLLCTSEVTADEGCFNKVELAPAYVHIDMLESRKTIKELDLAGIRGDLNLVIGKGWLLKANGLYGKEKDGELINYGVGFGRCLPLNNRWIVAPIVGVSYTKLDAAIHLDLGDYVFSVSERFKGIAPYAGLELHYKVSSRCRICASAQYAWTYSETNFRDFFKTKSDSEGPSYGLLVEYDLNQCWSVNVGAAYNENFSREKNGIRGRGVKLGVARWF